MLVQNKPSYFCTNTNVILLIIFYSFISLDVNAQIEEALIDYYKSIRNDYQKKIITLNYILENDVKWTGVFSDSCDDLLSFTDNFIKWSRGLSKNVPTNNPKCKCVDSVCFTDLSDFYPDFFRSKIYKKMNCNGPNCYNATLMARGFFKNDQFRYSSPNEFNYYLNEYCVTIPFDKKEANDIIIYSFNQDDLTIHAGLYISNNILFTKGGPHKSATYGLENWKDKFSDPSLNFKVYRCKDPTIDSDIKNSVLKASVNQYSELIGCNLPEEETIQKLTHIEKNLNEISNIIDHILDVNERHIFRSLKESIEMSKKKAVSVELENSYLAFVLVDIVSSIKKNLTDTTTTVFQSIDQLVIGEYISLKIVPFTPQALIFKEDMFYRIIDIL